MVNIPIRLFGKTYYIRNLEIFTFSILTVLYTLAYFLEPGMWLYEKIAYLSERWTETATNSDSALLMAFAFSTFGNTSILIVFPYALIVYLIGQKYSNWFLLGLVSGVGAAIGEISSYIVGRIIGSSKKISESEIGEKFHRIRRKFEEKPGSIPFTIFLFALTPLPDDAILVPFGIMKYPYWKSIPPCMLGKTLLCMFLAWLGSLVGQNADALNWLINEYPYLAFLRLVVPSNEVNPAGDLIQFSFVFIVIYLMVRIDFEALEIKRSKERKILERLILEGGNVTLYALEKKFKVTNKEHFKKCILNLVEKDESIRIKDDLIHFDGIGDKKKAFQLSFDFFKEFLLSSAQNKEKESITEEKRSDEEDRESDSENSEENVE